MNTTIASRTTAVRVCSVLGAVLAGVGLSACGDSDTASDLGDWCVEVEETSVPVCTRLHDDPIGLRLPDGEPIGVVARGGASFVTASGSFPLAAEVGDELAGADGPESVAYATTVYRATIDGEQVVEVTPVATVSEDALLTWVFGGLALEGTITEVDGEGNYLFDQRLPVRIELDPAAGDGAIQGRITNATDAVRAADGTCMPSLASAPGDPLVGGYTEAIRLTRSPSMHVPFEDELVLHWTDSASGMGNEFYPSLATAAGADELGDTWNVVLHGNPIAGPSLELRLVGEPTGADAC